MTLKRKSTKFDKIIGLISDSTLSIGFAKGSGLGAILLAVIVILLLFQTDGAIDLARSVFWVREPVQ